MGVPGSSDHTASRGAISWFVRNRVAANLLFFGISLAGLLTIADLPQEVIPEVRSSALSVRTILPGAGAEDVEQSILIPMEQALTDLSGVDEVLGLAAEGVGLVTVVVESSADFRSASNDIKERIESLDTLPRDAEDPVITVVQPTRLMLRVAVHGDAGERSLMEAAHLIRRRLTAIRGVGRVDIETGRDYEIAIEIPEERLSRFGLSFDQVADAIRRSSADVPGGTVRSRTGEVPVGAEAKAVTADDFSRIPLITTPAGGVVRVSDVATVTDGFAEVERTARMNGEPCVLLSVVQAPGAQLLETVEAVHRQLAEIRRVLPEGLSVTPWANAWSLFDVRKDLLVKNGLQGLALVFMVLFFTLSTRLAVWTTAGLPLAFFGAFLLMPGLGATLNMFTLFGFLLTLGIVVDDAIVVGENVERHVSRGGHSAELAVVRGVKQVFFPVAFGVLTTIVAFAPLFGLPGAWGQLMGSLPRIVIPVLAFSLLEAAWILPHHLLHGGLRVRPSRRLAQVRAAFGRLLERTVDSVYRPSLAWALRNRLTSLALGLSCFVLALGLIAGGWVRYEDTPPMDNNLITLQVSLPAGSPGEATAEVVAQVEDAVLTVREEFRSKYGTDPQRHLLTLTGQRLALGAGGDFGGAAAGFGAQLGQLTLELRDSDEMAGVSWRAVANRLRELTRSLPHGGEVAVNDSLLGEEANVSIRVSGSDMAELREASESLQRQIGQYAGVIAVFDDLADTVSKLVARTRDDGVGIGLGGAEVGRQLRQGFYGEEVQRVQRGTGELRVLLRYPPADREDPGRIADMRVRHASGAEASLGKVMEITREPRLSLVRRVDGRRAVTVHANVDSQAGSPTAVLNSVESRQLPLLREEFPNLRFDIVGVAGEARKTQGVLIRNSVLAMLLVYVLLAVPLSSWVQPAIVFIAVPFGVLGALLGHVVLGLDLSILSIFGIVPLVGIVVNDALVLLDFINQSRRRGMSVSEAVSVAGPLRFRPIVLTSLTTCAALLPLLLERDLEAQVLIPIAASLAFGVAFSTIISLLLVPVLYSLAAGAGGRSSSQGTQGSHTSSQ